jgi:hypothetical protein
MTVVTTIGIEMVAATIVAMIGEKVNDIDNSSSGGSDDGGDNDNYGDNREESNSVVKDDSAN